MARNVILDLTALAAIRPHAAELAARIRAGDLAACFDADQFLEHIDRATADARAFVADIAHTHDDGTSYIAAPDGLDYVIGLLSGSLDLECAVDDARHVALDD